ncbi:acVLRF1 family peptidyl-tRNA hydrolase [Amycolatopsis minnesotensis]|uniref:AcVLRF1 family peptidyl-tRNA hydrolase n=1 Tax=Amycolatopsis minnesotensis TaxID=337894 RepID=A0ABN2RW66_9PSEU
MPPERLDGWFARFADRHDGIARTCLGTDEIVVLAGNGTAATAAVPFPPLDVPEIPDVAGLAIEALVVHATAPRRIGLLLVRLGGHSVGVAQGGRVVVSRTARHLVHGRSAAGGWSQQRFARRREGQARHAVRAAAADAAEVLAARLPELDAVVLGGDRAALDEVRRDRRLAGIFALARSRVLDIPEPRRTVLDEAARRATAVEIVVRGA